MRQERNLPNSLPSLRVLSMILSEFQNMIYNHVSKDYVEMAEGSWSHPPIIIIFSLVFTYVPDLNTLIAPRFSDSKSLFYSLGQISFEN